MISTLLLLFQTFALLIILIPLSGLVLNIWIKLSQALKLSRKFIIISSIGLLLSLPELFIAITSIGLNASELSFGNSIGTAIILITLVAGVIAINRKDLKTNEVFSNENINLLSFIALINIILSFDGYLSQLDGLILIISYFFYLFVLSTLKGEYQLQIRPSLTKKKFIFSFVFMIFGIISIGILSHMINTQALLIHESSDFSLFSIGAVLIAPLGAIPELIFQMELDSKNKSKISLGELFTSLITNTTLIIGILLLFNPIRVDGSIFYYFTSLFLALSLLLFNYYSKTKNSINWKEGSLLLTSYIVYVLSCLILMLSSN